MSIIGLIVTAVLALLFLSAALAPLESLGWYAGWFGETDEETGDDALSPIEAAAEEQEPIGHYLVYLSGIGAIAPDSIPDEESPFIKGLVQILPETKVISDLFPYSVTNIGLTGQRFTARVWRRLEQLRLKNPMALAAFIVNLRNMIQVAISADRRYGPIYNLGVARAMRDSLRRHGYRIGSGVPVTLLGWSGGGQIALGAAWYLPGMIAAPVYVVSVGGVMSDDIGVKRMEHLWHLWGDKDPLAPLGQWLYAGRWALYANSAWNRALAAGKITMVPLGPFTHNGKGNYFDDQLTLPTGQTHMQYVLAKVREVLADAGLVSSQPAAGV
ncbi:MAG: hypothetical protein IT329_23165 [Caldilineaceae bacterium]|nr:hypothetical protein [Caldilineaceae bacterium]